MAPHSVKQPPKQEENGDPHGVNFFVVKKPGAPSGAGEQGLVSFETTMLPHLDAAKNLARWLCRNERDAEDVVQEAYLRAFKSFGGFHGTNGRAWLLTIVRNTSYTLLKKNRASELGTVFDEEIHATEDDANDPAALLQASEDVQSVRHAIEQLPAEFREILVLRHLEGMSYKEIAEMAQLATGTVMSRLARARTKLKEYMNARRGKG